MEPTVIENILLVGTGKVASGVVTNLAKHTLQLQVASDDISTDKEYIAQFAGDCKRYNNEIIDTDKVCYISSVEEVKEADIVICVTSEDFLIKQRLIQSLDKLFAERTIIAINTESFSLEELQQHTKYPHRIIGLNWCDPAYTTSFLEIIANDNTAGEIIKTVERVAISYWEKDPCVVRCGYSIKARLMAALAREAFYLVENGYASVEDVDRACRNDAGYYLPFAGNCRYMDLMGTYAYGLVMKDLNRELSKADAPPELFAQLLADGKTGMKTDDGFYSYTNNSLKFWDEKYKKFSFEIKNIIDKYPFSYLEKDTIEVKAKITQDE